MGRDNPYEVRRAGREKADAVIQARNSDCLSSGGSSSAGKKITDLGYIKDIDKKGLVSRCRKRWKRGLK